MSVTNSNDDSLDVLYHVTLPEHAKRIAAEGLQADEEGYIYLFTDSEAANFIVRGQILAKRYSLFEVARTGITVPLEADDVAEFSASLQRRVKQPVIGAQFLSFSGTFDTITDYPTQFDYEIYEHFGIPPQALDLQFECFRRMAAATSPEERRNISANMGLNITKVLQQYHNSSTSE